MSTTSQLLVSRLNPEVVAFLSTPVKMFIGGQWVDAAHHETFTTRDPGTGEELAQVASGTAEDIDHAVTAARHALRTSGWPRMRANDRAVILHRLADLVDKNAAILAELESLDVGKPYAQAIGGDIPSFSATLRYYADLSVNIRQREPIAVKGHEAYSALFPAGVAAFIIPWNFPFLLLGWSLGPSLAAGCTVVVKPAEDTPLSTLYVTKLMQEAGVPDGVVNVVPGFGETAGAALAAHPGINRMGFTGSPEVGRKVAASCGANLVPVKLELGGKGAAVLFDDIDVDRTARALAGAITLNTGQVCCTATRWLVHESIWDEFVNRSIGYLNSVRIGHGLAQDTGMGPVVSQKQQRRVLGYIEKGRKEGASALMAGGAADVSGSPGGFYVKPALLTGEPDNICAREEIFGPVAYLMPFRTEEQAVELVNRSAYGLANSVWSNDLERARRVAESLVAGNGWINAHNLFPQGVPYGGTNLSGFGGGVNAPSTLFDYLRSQSIVRPTG
ncbi:MAG: aldehyde dehydrogenase [Bryobacterales bacterium]|nr:aldehyde dehydrogenase [Bryobacterales bacterium]